MAISKILDLSTGSNFAIKLPQDIRYESYDRESQNCDWVLFSVTPLLNLADSLVVGQLEKYSDAIVRGHETRSFRDFNEIELVFQKQGK